MIVIAHCPSPPQAFPNAPPRPESRSAGGRAWRGRAGSGCRRSASARTPRLRHRARRGGRGGFPRGCASRIPGAARRGAGPPCRAVLPIAAVQSRSASAFVPIAIAGPLTGQGPSAARSRSPMSGEATAKPSLKPARPKVLPNERRMTAPVCGRKGARLSSSSNSAKASSTMMQPTAAQEPRVQLEQVPAARDPSVRVVGIDDDCDVGFRQRFERRRLYDPRAGRGEGLRMAAVGRPPARRQLPARAARAPGSAPASPGQRRRLRTARRNDAPRRPRARLAPRAPAAASTPPARDREADRGAD